MTTNTADLARRAEDSMNRTWKKRRPTSRYSTRMKKMNCGRSNSIQQEQQVQPKQQHYRRCETQWQSHQQRSSLSSLSRLGLVLATVFCMVLLSPSAMASKTVQENELQHQRRTQNDNVAIRRKIKDFVVHARPFPAPLLYYEANDLRDIIETFLSEFYSTYSWPNENTSVDYFGLAGVRSNKYNEETKTVELALGGLAYFSDVSVEVPDEARISQLVFESLEDQRDALIQVVKDKFDTVESVDFEPIESPSQPDPKPPTVPTRPEVAPDKVARGIDEPSTDPNSGVFSTSLIIIIAAATAFVIVGSILFVHSKRKRRQIILTGNLAKEDASHDQSLDDTDHDDDDASPSSLIGTDGKQFPRADPSSRTEDEARVPFPPSSSVDSTQENSNNISSKWGKEVNGGVRDSHNFLDRILTATASLPARMMLSAGHTSSDGMPAEDGGDHPFGDTNDVEVFDSERINSARQRDYPSSENTDEHSEAISSAISSDIDSTVIIEPHIIPVDAVESFEYQRRAVFLKKDMMASQDAISPYWQTAVPRHNSSCALKPTDVSAATLAATPREDFDDSRRRPPLPPSSMPCHWGEGQAGQRRGAGYQSSEGGDTFGTSDDYWDPDDTSMGDAASDISGVFQASVENRDEQSLLQHSLRNESYKMQRLRTPTNSARHQLAKGGSKPLSGPPVRWHSNDGVDYSSKKNNTIVRHLHIDGSDRASDDADDTELGII